MQNGAPDARARRFVPRRSEPLRPSTVLHGDAEDGVRSGNQTQRFPVVGSRVLS